MRNATVLISTNSEIWSCTVCRQGINDKELRPVYHAQGHGMLGMAELHSSEKAMEWSSAMPSMPVRPLSVYQAESSVVGAVGQSVADLRRCGGTVADKFVEPMPVAFLVAGKPGQGKMNDFNSFRDIYYKWFGNDDVGRACRLYKKNLSDKKSSDNAVSIIKKIEKKIVNKKEFNNEY